MYTYPLETCNKKQFIFEFSFNEEPEILEDNVLDFRYISYRLLRKDKPEEIFTWTGWLSIYDSEFFELSFPDKINIKGEMKLYKNNGEDFIFINTRYCYDLENHFEGNILKIPQNIESEPIIVIDPIIDPIIPPLIPDTTTIPNELISPSDFNDLFPYLYLRKWPNLTKMEAAYFVNYKQLISSPIVPSLYDQFLSNFNSNGVPNPNAREEITEEAFNFVNGIAPYTDQYIADTSTLPTPYNIFPLLYDEIQEKTFLNLEEFKIFILKKLTLVSENIVLKEFLITPYYIQLKNQIWQNVFALSTLNFYNTKGLQNEIKILLMCNIFENSTLNSSINSLEEINHSIKASIVLPSPVFPLPTANGIPQNTTQIIPYAIGDLHMIQHKLIGYELGEIAHIENVLPGEIKERSNASLQEISETSTTNNETLINTTNEWTANLEGLNTEIGNTLTGKDENTDNYNNLETSYGPPTTGTYNGTVTNTRIPNLNEKTNDTHFAKKVLNKTINRISRNIKQVFTHNKVRKTKEAVIHTLDNRNSEQNVRGIYNWVNKVYNTRVINYGNRFILEFIINKPFPKITSKLKSTENGLIAPANRAIPITSFNSITVENYDTLAADYGVTNVPLPPEECKIFYTFFNDDKILTAKELTIEEGYIPFKTTINYVINSAVTLLIGTKKIDLPTNSNHYSETLETKDIFQNNVLSLPIVLNKTISFSSPPSSSNFYINVSISCKPSKRFMNIWKIKVYDAIINAYKENIVKAKTKVNNLQNNNKAIIKEWMNTSIISTCKKMLYEIDLERNNNQSPPSMVNEPAYYQFFESALEWGEITYEFYEENDLYHEEKIQQTIRHFHTDEAPCQSDNKHVRVMIPVTPNFNNKMLYYLNTGFISLVENLVTPVFEEDKPVAVALKEANEVDTDITNIVYEPWKILVPTNMQWLQDGDELPLNNNETL